ncbi:mechanosensitive ion channel family protein [Sutcliffiella cohnii]|uniref:mechanosensitive ion channel family protein n=1 Tax=Sutcliffiella TaxID=2837511 RepID=UPI0022DCF5C6|nr:MULTISPECIES: mechanosensitive ion channel family protein [Sutcliffiella]MED4014833.1 mechanosensitive ion channel family protein [Sutcliffiella cohnii]WBL17421.1 mechanosensitive ion channel family protein [Sutcliffiella sp. NC1]
MFDLTNYNLWAILAVVGTVILKLVIILIAYGIVKSLGTKLIKSLFERAEERQNLTRGRSKTLEKLVINIFTYTLMFFLFILVLENVFKVEATPILAGAGIVGLAIGFGAQGLVSDVVTGFFLLLEKQVDVDDYVTTAGFSGIVEEVGLRTTKIRDFDGTLHYIPNREISSLSNHSRGNMRALVDISISYDDNIDKAMMVLQKVCDRFAQEEEAIKEGPNVVGVQSLGDSDVVIRIVAKTENMEQWAVERKLRKAMKEALDANGIEIPFPHQVYIEKKA